jgi:curli production assembly/transport component CsgF
MKIIYSLSIFILSLTVQAQDLVYKPKNPNFGGDTFNYQWLLSSADSQNLFKEERDTSGYQQKTELQRFTENLNNKLLNHISGSLFGEQFGTGVEGGTGSGTGMTEGTYVFGSLSVDVYPSSDGTVVNILDIYTGEQTQIIIP